MTRKRPYDSGDQHASTAGQERPVEDVLKNATTPSCSVDRISNFLSADKTTTAEKEKEAKSVYLQGLSPSTVSSCLQI